MEAIRQEFLDCKAYGGNTVLVVPAVVNRKVGYRDAYKRSQENIRKLIPDAEASGVKIAIEEVWNKFLLSPVEFARYIDEFESPWVGAYFDVGNVVEFGYPEEWIRELGKRILKVHIKEYAKEKRFKYRLGEGREIDWKAVRGALLDCGYDGWITAEVPYGNSRGDERRRSPDEEVTGRGIGTGNLAGMRVSRCVDIQREAATSCEHGGSDRRCVHGGLPFGVRAGWKRAPRIGIDFALTERGRDFEHRRFSAPHREVKECTT